MIRINITKLISRTLSLIFNQRSRQTQKNLIHLPRRIIRLESTFKSLVIELFQLGLSWLKGLLLNLVLSILNTPFQIEKAFTPDRYGSQPVSRFFRKAFEAKGTKQILGANLAVLILATSIYQSSLPILATEPEPVEVLPEPKEVITTETTLRQPVGGYISQGFHWYHPGIDIAGNDYQIVYPIAKGVVTAVESSRFGYGNSIIITHENNLISRYAHLSRFKVGLGDTVDKNTALGYVGSTGWSTGNHLHLEIYEDGRTINPLTVLPAYFEE